MNELLVFRAENENSCEYNQKSFSEISISAARFFKLAENWRYHKKRKKLNKEIKGILELADRSQ